MYVLMSVHMYNDIWTESKKISEEKTVIAGDIGEEI